MKKPAFNKIDKKEILYHLIFWAVHFIFRLYLRGYYEDPTSDFLYEELITLPIRMFGAYLTIYLFKHYLFNKKYTAFFSLLPFSIVLILSVRRLVGYFIIEPFFYTNFTQSPLQNISVILKYTVYVYPVITTAVAITIVRRWYYEQIIKRELEKENLKAQLNQLKGQIQPHFLFNTLNNIYSLSIENSKHTSESILKLSDLLDYMLYKTNTPIVILSDEIKLLKDYIELEKLRYGNRLNVTFNTSPDINEFSVPPLLFLPVVENCFKHGVCKTIGNSWIYIDFTRIDDMLICKFENSKYNETINKINEGIGLKNVRKRLDILYPQNHELKIMNEKASFLVIIKINTAHIPTSVSL